MDMALPRSPYKSVAGLQRIYAATSYSIAGLKTAWQQEAAFRQISWLNFVLMTLNFSLSLTVVEHILLLALSFLAWIVELLNSAIEAVVDRISLEQHVLSKNAKDLGSAAQSVSLVLMLLMWGIILFVHYMQASFAML